MTLSTITVQTLPQSQPSTPHWMGEVAAFAQILGQTGILNTIIERVLFSRARMGTYDLIDFVVVLIGYTLSGEPTLQAFYCIASRESSSICSLSSFSPVFR